MAKKASSKPLKKLKYELNKCYELNDKDKIIKTILKIIEIYPNNSYGYIKLIEYKTNNFRKYIKDE